MKEEKEQESNWNFLPKKSPKKWTWSLGDPTTWYEEEEEKKED